jgi:isopentenyldiphosphate isomerase
MRPLSHDDLGHLQTVRHDIGYGWALTQTDLDRLAREWAERVAPDESDAAEDFALVRPDGSPLGASGPRWLFHLLGLTHLAAHVALATPNGLVVVQRRAATKIDWPDAWDMAAAGHVPSGMSFEEGAWKEIEEEIGLPEAEAATLLVEGRLTPVGKPYFCYDRNVQRNPPFANAESRQLYAATLTPVGLARLQPDYDELSGIHLCTVEEAWALLDADHVASGLRSSLPRYLDWLVAQGIAAPA